jgi:hypothetical protein
MTEGKVAEVLGLSVRTVAVARDWQKARLFLHACLSEPPGRSLS